MTLAEIKFNMNDTVLYKGNEYTLIGCIFRKDKKTNQFYYQAELFDRCERSTLVCRLEDVERSERK